MFRLQRSIQRINLLAQNRPFECAAGLTLLLQRKALWQNRIFEQPSFGCGVVESRFTVILAGFAACAKAGIEVGDMVAVEKHAGVEPRFGEDRRQVRGTVNVVAGMERREGFGVPLFHHAEAAKLALHAVKVAMVEGVAGDEIVFADADKGLYLLAYMDGEWQAGDPRMPG